MTPVRPAMGMLRALASGRRVPLLVSWNLTYRCNLACRYCGLHRTSGPEASTREVLARVADLARLGARTVGFSGGEPLMRRDLSTIVAACRDHGLAVSIQTNGTLLRRSLPRLDGLREVRVSLDGPRDSHDAARGAGSFDAAVDAIRACLERGVPVLATAVLTDRSILHLSEFLDIARGLGIGVLFQPMDARFAGGLPDDDPLYPHPEAFRRAVDLLLGERSRGNPAVLNSPAGLRYMRGWPDPDPIPCRVGRFLCTVDADGRVFACDMYPGYERHLVTPDADLERTLGRLDLPSPCPRCISGAMVDLNLAASGRLDAIPGLLSRLGTLLVGRAGRTDH